MEASYKRRCDITYKSEFDPPPLFVEVLDLEI